MADLLFGADISKLVPVRLTQHMSTPIFPYFVCVGVKPADATQRQDSRIEQHLSTSAVAGALLALPHSDEHERRLLQLGASAVPVSPGVKYHFSWSAAQHAFSVRSSRSRLKSLKTRCH